MAGSEVQTKAICGAVDVGGTKMLARLFGPDMTILQERREDTPPGYGAFLDRLGELLAGLRASGGEALPLGVALPGFADPGAGGWVASNLPVCGHDLPADLAKRGPAPPTLINDSTAFALSEAVGGAGAGARVMVGLIVGTGMAAGLCVNGQPLPGGAAMEIGHLGLPLRAARALGLDLWDCGCLESYTTGAGLTRLAEARIGRPLTGETLAAALVAGDPEAQSLFADWCALVAEALAIVQLTCAPDVVVLGGGLSALPGAIPALTRAFAATPLPVSQRADLRLARFGVASGARGAGIAALQKVGQC